MMLPLIFCYYFTLSVLISFYNFFPFSEIHFFFGKIFYGAFPSEEYSPQLYQMLLAHCFLLHVYRDELSIFISKDYFLCLYPALK